MSDQLPNPARADALNESQGQAVQQGAATVTAPAAQGALMMGGPHGNATPLAPLPPPGYNITSPQQFAGPSVPNGGYMFLNNLAMGNAHQQMHQLQQMQMMHHLQQTQQAQQPVQQAQTSQWVGMAGLAPSHGVPASPGPMSVPLPTSAKVGQCPSISSPWNPSTDKAEASSSQVPKFGPVEDECGSCYRKYRDLFLMDKCKHYPFCIDCVKRESRSGAAGLVRCPHCHRVSDKAIPVQRMKSSRAA